MQRCDVFIENVFSIYGPISIKRHSQFVALASLPILGVYLIHLDCHRIFRDENGEINLTPTRMTGPRRQSTDVIGKSSEKPLLSSRS